MQRWTAVPADSSGEFALRIVGVALAQDVLGRQRDALLGWKGESEGRTGDAGADDDDVVVLAGER
jgi:hypothetical protein